MNQNKIAEEIFYILDEWYQSKNCEVNMFDNTNIIKIKRGKKTFSLRVRELTK
ncbi:MAG: hypothetical protein AABW47_04485 [Nanoarchaeota archaeon]